MDEFTEIDYDLLNEKEQRVFDLVYQNISIERIAMYFGVSRGTMYNKYRQIIAAANLKRELELRRAQRCAALGGNATMLVWLGKNELGQADAGMNVDSNEDVTEVTFKVRRVPKPNYETEIEEQKDE